MLHSTPQLAVLLIIVALLFLGRRRLRDLGMHDNGLERLREELRQQMPVFSAETTRGKEAEFIRDRLPKKFPWLLFLAGVLLLGAAAAWWASQR